jgi:hypothetical protein
MDAPEPPVGQLEEVLLAAAHDQANRCFMSAWLGWRQGRLLPKRSAIELGDIKELLGRVILFELISPDEVLVKVAGSQLRDHIDFEATGRNLRDFTPTDQWPVRRWRINMLSTQPCGARMINVDTRTSSGQGVAFETVTLPVEPDEPEKPRLVMSHVAVLGNVYDPPAKDRPRLVWLPENFHFLDIGASVPAHTKPHA